MFHMIEWMPAGAVRLLDQHRLPMEEAYVECRDVAAVANKIGTYTLAGPAGAP